MHIGKNNLYQHLGPHSGTDMDAHRAIPSTGHSGVSPCQQHTHVLYHHTSSSTHLSQDPPSLSPPQQTQVHTSKPISQPSRLPSSLFRCSLGTSLKGLGAILPWSAAAPDPQVMLEVSGDLPHTGLGVTGYGIHLSYLHEWSERQMHIKCCVALGRCHGRSLLL